jgi:hypothetical protein
MVMGDVRKKTGIQTRVLVWQILLSVLAGGVGVSGVPVRKAEPRSHRRRSFAILAHGESK